MADAINDLISQIRFRTGHREADEKGRSCWLTDATASRWAVVVPAMYGPLDFWRLVDRATVDQAVRMGLLEVGEPELMPVYNYGGPKYRWKTIQQGRRVRLPELKLEPVTP